MKNEAIRFLEERCEGLEDYDGNCGELVDAMMHWLGEGRIRILYIEPRLEGGALLLGDHCWSYHMVPVIDGRVHDAWQPDLVVDVEEYVLRAFPDQIFRYDFPAEREAHD